LLPSVESIRGFALAAGFAAAMLMVPSLKKKFLFVLKISLEPLNGFARNSQG